MGQENYAAERLWLQAYFDYCDDIYLDIEAQIQMTEMGITLPEILYVFRSPEVIWAERDHDGCVFYVKGRSCDDEWITIFGGFNSETQHVSVFSLEKI